MTRIIDVTLSILAIFILFPLLLLCMCILRFTGESEIFYFQPRIGRYGKSFKIMKFATMLKNSPKIGSGNLTLQNDPRVLPFGKFLRHVKINELPQLFNILIGDMSLVGPRPVTVDHFNNYSKKAREEISLVRPGLTGIGSIFFRSEEKFLQGIDQPVNFYKNVIAPYKEELELWYVKNASVRLYFKIILLTARVVITSRNFDFDRYFPSAPKAHKELRLLQVG